MPEPKRPLKVFLCHARDDKVKTRELYRYLRKRGIQPWLDAEDLVAGQDWRVEIPKAIKASDAIIICLSKNSINKEGFVQAEITFALEKALEIPQGRIFIIPARFEDCEVPDNLERFHWVDLFDEDGFPKLMKSLKARATQLERATVQVPQPDEASPNLTPASKALGESESAQRTRMKAEQEAAKKLAPKKKENETRKHENTSTKLGWPSSVAIVIGIVTIFVGLIISLSQFVGPISAPTSTTTATLTNLPPSRTLQPTSTSPPTPTFTLTLTKVVISSPTMDITYCSWGKDIGSGLARYECGCFSGSCSCTQYLYNKKSDYQNNKQNYISSDHKSYSKSYVDGQVRENNGSCSGN